MSTPKAEIHLSLKDKLNGSLDAARHNLNKNVNAMQTKLNSLRGGSTAALSAVGNSVPGIGGAFAALTNPIGIATVAITGLVAATGKAIISAKEWQQKMAEINTTAGLTQKELKGLSNRLLEVGSRNSADLDEVPKAFLRIISAGLSVKQSMASLEPTLRAAKAGFTDIETTAGAGIATMMSSGENINKVYDILFNTVKEGNASFKEIARYLPKIIPVARNVGFALDETAGAYASLTTKLSAEQSTTALAGIMRSLSNEKVLSKFKSIGVEVFDVKTGKVKPILDIIKQVQGAMSGLTDSQRTSKFAGLGLDDMSKLGFAALTQDVKGLEKAINATVNSQGALNKAYKDSITPLEHWNMVFNSLKASVVNFGQLFLPMISRAGEKMLSFINYWKSLYKESVIFRDVLQGIAWLGKKIWDVQLFGMRRVFQILGWIIDLVKGFLFLMGKIIAKVTFLGNSWTDMYLKIKPLFLWMRSFLLSIADIMDDLFNFKFSDAKEKFKNFKLPNLKDITAKVLLDAKPREDSDDDLSEKETGINPITPVAAVTDSSSIIKGGGQSKNLTVNIDSFVKNLSAQNKEINKMSLAEMEKAFTEMFMRVVRSVELEY